MLIFFLDQNAVAGGEGSLSFNFTRQ